MYIANSRAINFKSTKKKKRIIGVLKRGKKTKSRIL